MSNDSSAQKILDFWFDKQVQPLWFNSTAEFDNQVLERFDSLWNKAMQGELEHWTKSPDSTLALIILLDQFPLNMYRGLAKSFASEAVAITTAKQAIEKGFDKQLNPQQKAFFYMPLMHSENLEDQKLSVELFSAPGLEDNAKFAKHHFNLIKRFGRFPHRNAILGRNSSTEELEYLNSEHAFKG